MPFRPAALIAIAVTALVACAPPDPGAQLHELIEREWQWRLAENPLLATSVGDHEHDHRMPSARMEDLEMRAEETRAFLRDLDALDRDALDAADRINFDIFRAQLENRVSAFEFGDYLIPINADSGFHTGLARLHASMPFMTTADYENYIARMRAIPAFVDQHIELMRMGLELGMTVPAVTLEGYEETISAHVVDDPSGSVFHAPFARFPVGVPEDQRDRLLAAGEAAILESVVPAYRRFLEFFLDDYRPGARATLGASELPGGRDYYEHLVRYFTTLDLSPEEVHMIGLDEVDRILTEMHAVIEQVEFEGGLQEFIEYLRTEPRFYPETAEELLKEASYIAKQMDGKLPALFKTLPRQPYGIEPVPDHLAPKYTAGRYVGSPLSSARPGYYWLNTYALETRPLYNLVALTLHEAVPGHHLQIALARELEDLPPFRRHGYLSAFGEGWGLYSEWLGVEAGMYDDPYSNFGRLTYEMWRACRLVVDTGVHAMGWTRDEVMHYLAEHTALPLHEVRTETDRYISWPGQALAYKIGELKIRELRQRAEEALGPDFDVREFHDAVLANGAVPLPVLEQVIEEYIETRR